MRSHAEHRNEDTERGNEFRWSDWSPKVTRLNAPRQSGAKLIEPPLALAGDMAATNKQTIAAADYDVEGRGLAVLAVEAHEQLLSEALRYTRGYRDVSQLVFQLGKTFDHPRLRGSRDATRSTRAATERTDKWPAP